MLKVKSLFKMSLFGPVVATKSFFGTKFHFDEAFRYQLRYCTALAANQNLVFFSILL